MKTKREHKLMKITMGAAVIALIASFFENGLGFVALSIICTFGISLVIWIPLAYAIGAGVLLFGKWRRDRRENKETRVLETPSMHAVSEFIQSARAIGKSDAEISTLLLQKGWDKELIDRILSLH